MKNIITVAAILVGLAFSFIPVQSYTPPSCGSEFSGQIASLGIRDCVLDDADAEITLVKPTNGKVDFVIVDGVLVVRNNSVGRAKFLVTIE